VIPTFVENVASFFRIEESGVEGYNFLLGHVAVVSLDTSVSLCQITHCKISEDRRLLIDRLFNIKFLDPGKVAL